MFKNCFKFLILVLNVNNYLQKELDDFFNVKIIFNILKLFFETI